MSQGLANLLNGFARLSPPYHPGNDFLSDLRDESLWRLAGERPIPLYLYKGVVIYPSLLRRTTITHIHLPSIL